jgi:MOSC domain-containing protein YiiM
MITIHSLCYQPTLSEDKAPFHYTRIPVNSVNLIAGHGIEGDRKAGHNPKRQLNIMSYETVAILQGEGYKAQPGELGEQIIVNGIDIAALPSGTRLQLGESAVIEVVNARTGCDWFEKIQEKPKANTVGRLGMMATVIENGIVRVGDEVRVLETVTVAVEAS